MRKVFRDFREFALKGNVLDVAIGILIGSGVTPIASSLINDIIMPPVGYIIGNADLTNLFISIKSGFPQGPYSSLELAKEAGAVTINYGKFLNTILSFVVISWVAFLLVKSSNKFKLSTIKSHQGSVKTMKNCKYCTSEISINAMRCPFCTSYQKRKNK